jgi:transcriptional regulator with XRE-family HTH domain
MMPMDVSKRITEFREQKGITVNKLANLSGISQSFIREIELGIKKPSVETLSLICDALNISLKDFFDDGSPSAIFSNDLMTQIYRLTPQQKQILTEFLKAMNNEKQ